jgi:hypothetical protein
MQCHSTLQDFFSSLDEVAFDAMDENINAIQENINSICIA